MPEFRYSAINIKGQKINGVKKAKDKETLKSELLAEDMFLMDFSDTNALYDSVSDYNEKKSSDNLTDFSDNYRLFTALIKSGLPPFKALNIVLKNDLPKNLSNVMCYSSIDSSGHKKNDIMIVKDKAELKSELEKKDEFLLDSYENIADNFQYKKLSLSELSEFCRELSAMLSSGIPLVKSLSIIINRDMPKNLKNVFSNINIYLKRGLSLSEAMEQQKGVFPELMINMIKSGEEAGNLDVTTEKLALMYQKEHRMNMKIKSALAYPAFLFVFTIIILSCIFTFVLPKFMKLFDNVELPATTKFVMSAGELFSTHFIEILIGAFVVIASVIYLLKNKSVKLFIDKKLLKLPAVGNLMKIIYTSRFANTLASLYASGIPLVTAVNISGTTIGNSYIAGQVTEAAKKIRSGNTLAASISRIDGFDKKISSSIAVGEESGKIDTLLSSLSDSYEYEANNAMTKLISFIEPAMIIIMGGFIAFVVISVMQAVYMLYSNVR